MPASPRILIASQFLSEGSGGIAEVARMTARTLGAKFPTRALACQDARDFQLEKVPVRAFQNSRPRFVLGLMGGALSATHIVHDFVGTARAQALVFPKKPHAIWAHGVEVWDRPRPDHVKALRAADLVLVNSAYTLARAQWALKGAQNVKLCLLGTSNDDEPATAGPSDGPPTVMILGRIDPGFPKGHGLLMEVWPRIVDAVPEAKLLIVGGGPALGEARERARASSVAASIEVTGFVPGEAMDATWRRASVYAMPSAEEGFGIVFIEAMRRGLPVIATTEDAGREVNQDGVTGFTLAREDRGALADAIVHLLRDRDAAARMGAAGRLRWREQFRFSAFAARLEGAMEGFLGA